MKKERQDSGKYIRVGTTLYKIVRRPLISGDYNRSERYAEFKDLNDYLCQKPMVKQEVKKKNLGFKR